MQLSETTEVTATMSLRDNAQSAWKLPIWGWFKPTLDSKFIGWRQVRQWCDDSK